MRNDRLEVVYEALFSPEEQQKLSEGDRAMIERLQDAYTTWISKPVMSDIAIRDYLMTKHSLSRSQAYKDIAIIKVLLGNVPLATKEFFRHKANFILDEAYAAATAGNDKKAKALTKIAEAIVYNNRTNEDDGEKYPWDKIVPKDASFSINPEDAGVQSVRGISEKAKKLKEKYEEDFEIITINNASTEQEDIPQ